MLDRNLNKCFIINPFILELKSNIISILPSLPIDNLTFSSWGLFAALYAIIKPISEIGKYFSDYSGVKGSNDSLSTNTTHYPASTTSESSFDMPNTSLE